MAANILPNATREYALLQDAKIAGVRKAFDDEPSTMNLLKKFGMTKKSAKSFLNKALVHTGNAGTAGARRARDYLPGQTRVVAGETEVLTEAFTEIQFGLTNTYAGMTDDGLTVEASRNSQRYADLEDIKLQSMRDCIQWSMECALVGPGDGRVGEISSISGTSVVLKGYDATTATTGKFGTELLRQGRQAIIAVDPSTGTKRTVGGTRGALVVGDPVASTRTLTTSRDMSSAWAAGDILVEGDDRADSYNNVPIGLLGMIDDGTTRDGYYGLRRANPDNAWLKAYVHDASSGGSPGEYNAATIALVVAQANRRKRAGKLLIFAHQHMALEAQFGSFIEGGNPTTRTIAGPHEQRRYMDDGDRIAGNSGELGVNVQGYGKAVLRLSYTCPPGMLLGLDPSNLEWFEWGDGLTPLGGGAGKNGDAVRESDRHIYHRGWFTSWNVVAKFFTNMWKMNHVRHQAGN